MEAIEALLTRRAVREFTSQPVTDEQIETILKAAMHAPSACNQQPWHFLVVTERERLNAITEVHPFAQMLKQAPLSIIVCADQTLETCPGNWPVDCSAAMQNLLLAAHAIGLGGVWVGIYPREERITEIRKLFSLPGYIQPLALAAIGYAKNPLPVVDRFNPSRIHRETW